MATSPPVETDILCESCGYMLNGLPETGKCPECGTPIDLSVSQALRVPALWEDPDSPRGVVARFALTSAQILITPTRFYRSLKSRGEIAPAGRFANIHWIIASLLLGTAAWFHWLWAETMVRATNAPLPGWERWGMLIGLPIATYAGLTITITIAGRLTAWESAYRGYRLPLPVVRRALYYHAADLLPVSIIALITTGGYFFIRQNYLDAYGDIYLYLLSGEVILSAVYLFATYWIAMRNLLYANR